MRSPVEYKIYWPKAGKVELSFPLGDGTRLYLYRTNRGGRIWYEAKRARPRVPARWLNPATGRDGHAMPSSSDEARFLAAVGTWLEDAVEPLTLTLFLEDLRAVWAYAVQDQAWQTQHPPATPYLVPDSTARFLARSLSA